VITLSTTDELKAAVLPAFDTMIDDVRVFPP